MAFPKKNTRKIMIDNAVYLWHLNADWDRRRRWIVVRRKDCASGQLLMIDPYHHDFIPSRGAITRAVRFGIKIGWEPGRKGNPVRLSFVGRETGFQLSALQANEAPPDDFAPDGA